MLVREPGRGSEAVAEDLAISARNRRKSRKCTSLLRVMTEDNFLDKIRHILWHLSCVQLDFMR
jgi:hypothetical protein